MLFRSASDVLFRSITPQGQTYRAAKLTVSAAETAARKALALNPAAQKVYELTLFFKGAIIIEGVVCYLEFCDSGANLPLFYFNSSYDILLYSSKQGRDIMSEINLNVTINTGATIISNAFIERGIAEGLFVVLFSAFVPNGDRKARLTPSQIGRAHV